MKETKTQMKQRIYNSIMESIEPIVRKRILETRSINEGAGAGYEITMKGLRLDCESIDIDRTSEDGTNPTNPRIIWTANLRKCILDTWSAIGYDKGVTSKGVEYNGEIIIDYGREDRTVNEGSVSGYLYLDEFPYAESFDDVTEYDMLEFLRGQYEYGKVSVRVMYGNGYIHTDLENEFTLTGPGNEVIEEASDFNHAAMIFSATINAPEMAQDINWYFANAHRLDEVIDEMNAEDDDMNESMKSRSHRHLNESFASSVVRDFSDAHGGFSDITKDKHTSRINTRLPDYMGGIADLPDSNIVDYRILPDWDHITIEGMFPDKIRRQAHKWLALDANDGYTLILLLRSPWGRNKDGLVIRYGTDMRGDEFINGYENRGPLKPEDNPLIRKSMQRKADSEHRMREKSEAERIRREEEQSKPWWRR